MHDRLVALAALAAETDGVLTARQLEAFGVTGSTRSRWVQTGLLVRLGTRSFAVAGAPATWRQAVRAAVVDLAPDGVAAGRSAARLHRLDGFDAADAVELLVPRRRRSLRTPHLLRSTRFALERGDVVARAGVRTLSAERLILDAPLFRFRRREVENAIDSALRLRLISEQRLRSRVEQRTGRRLPWHGSLVAALVDSGGETALERSFLALVRRAGLPRPEMQRIYREGTRTIARVDAYFPGGLIVEVEGHATHSSRRQRQHDEQRRTELTLRGQTVIAFTYVDVDERPEWVAGVVARALRTVAPKRADEITESSVGRNIR